MICQSCGNEIANNSIMCPICGEAVVRRFDLDTNEFSVGGFEDSGSSYVDLKPAKKPVNVTSIIIAIFIIIAGAGVGFFAYKNKQNKELHKYDGTYRFYSISVDGTTLTTQEFQDAGYKTDKVCIVIKGDTADFEGWEEIGAKTMKGAISFEKDGDNVVFKSTYGAYIEGTLIGDELSLDNEASIIFRKE